LLSRDKKIIREEFMAHHRFLAILTAAGVAVLSAAAAHAAEPPLEIGVVQPMTGAAAFVGSSGKQAIELAEKLVNQEGGVNGRPVHFTVLDDQTSPQVAVQLTSSLIAKGQKIVLGSSITAMCNAMAGLAQNGPVIYCFSPGIHPKPGSFVFSATVSSEGLVETLVRYFHRRGWKKLALIVTTDGSGQDGERAFDQVIAKPDLKDIEVVARGHFAPADATIGAVIENIHAAQPQAVIAWTTGTTMGTVLKGMAQAGLDLPVGTTSGNISYPFVEQFASVLPRELYFATNSGTARGEGLKLDPRVAEAKRKYHALFEQIGVRPDNGAEVVWDATMIAIDALGHAGPDASAQDLRTYIAQLKGFAGISGVYDFPAEPQRGLKSNAALVARWNSREKFFEAVTQPGGEPIQR
jgi:branched-chain amino acid transport system substrate-binding protein